MHILLILFFLLFALSAHPQHLVMLSNTSVKLWVEPNNGQATLQSSICPHHLNDSAPQTISTPANPIISSPLVKANPAYGAVALWQSQHHSGNFLLEAALFLSDYGWGSACMISDPSEDISIGDYDLQIDETGTITIRWQQKTSFPPTQFEPRTAIGSFETWPSLTFLHK